MLDISELSCDICGEIAIYTEDWPDGWFCSDDGKHSIDLCPECAEKYTKPILGEAE